MIQQLLRGRLVYYVLGVLVVMLYIRHVHRPPKGLRGHVLSERGVLETPEALEEPAGEPTSTLEWWPRNLDPATLQRAVMKRPRLGLELSVLSVYFTGMTLGGVLLTGWAVWSGRWRTLRRKGRRRLPVWSVGELGRILALALLVAGLLPFVRFALPWAYLEGFLEGHWWLVSSMLILDLFVILAVLTFAVGKSTSVWRATGLTGRGFWRPVAVGLRGYLAAFPWLFLLLIIIAGLAQTFGFQPPVEPIHELIFREQQPWVLTLTVVLACAIGPLAEELLFRGVLYPVVRRWTTPTLAMVVSGSMFALAHTNVIGFLPIMGLGTLLAYLYERTGSLVSSLVVHIVHNAFLLWLAMVVRQLSTLAAG